MSVRSKAEIEQELRDWYAARARVQKGQSYGIGTRNLTRADLGEINDTIDALNLELARVDSGGRAKVRRGLYAG